MAKKLTPGQVVRELNDIVFTFSGKSISSWVQEAWEKSQKTTIGQAAAGVERAARAVDPYAVLGLPHSASLEDVERRYRQLSFIYHPDKGELEDLLGEVIEDERMRRPVKRERAIRIMVEEPTTEEFLEAEAGELFPEGIITGEILAQCIEMDGKYTLKELRNMCREAGLSPSGEKKLLAAKLIAKGIK
ncbi:hypothetical protein ES703_59948 [subsurface metagenome]